MMRRLFVVSILAVVLCGIGASCTVAPGGDVDVRARDLFDRINGERSARGLPALNWDAGLANSASAWARDMAANGVRHSAFAPENIYSGGGGAAYYGNSAAAHRTFMQSDGHRTNVLAPGYDKVGVGVACVGGTIFVVEQFGVGPGGSGIDSTPPVGPITRGDGNQPACG